MGLIRDSLKLYLTNDGTPAVFRAEWKRTTALSLTLYDVDLVAKDVTGYTIRASVRRRPYDSTLLGTFTLALTTPLSGVVTLSFAATDFPTLTWDEGQRYQVLWMDFEAVDGSAQSRSVADGQQNFLFPLYVWQSIRGTP